MQIYLQLCHGIIPKSDPVPPYPVVDELETNCGVDAHLEQTADKELDRHSSIHVIRSLERITQNPCGDELPPKPNARLLHIQLENLRNSKHCFKGNRERAKSRRVQRPLERNGCNVRDETHAKSHGQKELNVLAKVRPPPEIGQAI